jgi:hypothetical protein
VAWSTEQEAVFTLLTRFDREETEKSGSTLHRVEAKNRTHEPRNSLRVVHVLVWETEPKNQGLGIPNGSKSKNEAKYTGSQIIQ